MKLSIYFILFIYLLTGCTKDNPIPSVDEDKEEELIPEKPGSEEPKEVYKEKTWDGTRSRHYLASDVTDDLYLGLIWHLKDTADHVDLEPLGFEYEPFDIWYMTLGSHPLKQQKPTYKVMKDYVYTNASNAGAGGLNFHSTSFSDYAEIKRWLPDNIDRKRFLELAEHGDSTVARKPSTALIRSEHIQFMVDTDFSDFQTNFSQKYLEQVLAKERSPYFFVSASYGKHLIIMAESDSTRASLNTALENLMEDKVLDETDEKVLTASKVLLYFRGGKKESLIEKAEGAGEIKTLLDSFNKEWRDKENQYDFPLYYEAMNLKDWRMLQYGFSFEYLVKEKE